MTAVLNPATLTAMHEGVLMHSGEDGLVYLLTDAGEAIPLQDPIGLTALDSAQLTAMGGDWLVMNSAGELAILEPAAPRVVGDNLWEGQVRALAAPRAGSPICAAALRNATSAPRLSPGLRLDFTPGETLDPRITFTRASTATRFNASGLIESVAINAPRFDYDPVTLAPKGLLIEEARTNLLLRSEEFDNASWNLQHATVTANAATSPDGTVDADRLVDNTTTGPHRVYQAVSKAASAIAYTGSVYLKADTLGFATVRITGVGEAAYTSVGINLSTGELSALGTVGFTSVSATVANAGNGWWRVALTGTSDTTTSISLLVGIATSLAASSSYTGTGTGSIYLYGAQLEAGAFATSYIPTTASQVTRAADVPVIQAPNFAPWYNQSEGTFVVEADSFASVDTSVRWAVSASNSPANSRNTVFLYNGKWGASARISGTDQCDIQQTGSYTPNTAAKIAFAYKANDFAASVNGLAALTDNSGSIPSVDRLFVGVAAVATNAINGHIRSIRYYPVRLPNATLQSLTA